MGSGSGFVRERSFDGFFEFEIANGLGQVRGCACFHAILDIRRHALGSDHDDRDVGKRGVAAHLAQNIQP